MKITNVRKKKTLNTVLLWLPIKSLMEQRRKKQKHKKARFGDFLNIKCDGFKKKK